MELKDFLGAKIRSRRKEKGLSQARLAEIVDISAKYLGEVERGEGNITVFKLERIAEALDIRLGKLLDNYELPSPGIMRSELANTIRAADDASIVMLYKMSKAVKITYKVDED
jgi:transcriptional regulator with XRE-family HTH domain